MASPPKPFVAIGSDGNCYHVHVVYDEFDGVIGRVAWMTDRDRVISREDGVFVLSTTGVELEPLKSDNR